MAIRQSNTKLTVDQILDGAADVLEASGWVTGLCHDSETGGHCAIGAIAQAVYPKAKFTEIEDLSYVDHSNALYEARTGRPKDPRHVEAVAFLGERIQRGDRDRFGSYNEPAEIVYDFNDHLADGVVWEHAKHEDGCENYSVPPIRVVDRKVNLKSSRAVVKRMRSAAQAWRKQQAKAAA